MVNYESNDRVPRELIWWVLNKKNVPRCVIEIIKDIYEEAVTSVRTTCGKICGFPMTIGFH